MTSGKLSFTACARGTHKEERGSLDRPNEQLFFIAHARDIHEEETVLLDHQLSQGLFFAARAKSTESVLLLWPSVWIDD